MKSGNLNFLETSGPLQACNGTGLLYLYLYLLRSIMTISQKPFNDNILFFQLCYILPYNRECISVIGGSVIRATIFNKRCSLFLWLLS